MSSSAPAPAKAARSKLPKISPRNISLLIALLVGAGVLIVNHMGWLQFLEFKVYDYLIRKQPKAKSSEPTVLIQMTESDIHNSSLDHPIPDDKLAQLLTILSAAKPAAIGLDMWRDIPVPKSGTGLGLFNAVLQAHSNIVVIFTLGGIAPPPVLRSDPERIGFNDNFPPDVEVDHTIPKVRRTMLIGQGPAGQAWESLSYRLAQLYLEPKGIIPVADTNDANVIVLGRARLRRFQPNDGGYVGADANGWQILIDFKCPDERIPRFTFSDVLEGRVAPEKLQDKVLIIGVNSPSVFDERVTPINANHSGPVLQSQVVNQLVREAVDGETPLQFWPDWLEDSWTLVWCLVGGTIGYWIRATWRFALAVVVCLFVLAGIAAEAFASGWWIPAVMPALGFVPATVLVVSYVSFQEQAMRNVLMKLYSRHVSKEIAESMWANRDSFLDGSLPRAQKLIVTVLFTDLKGFSTISETMEPAVLYEWLNGYLGAMAKVIQDHGGVLKQFTGDGILVLFGVPLPHTTKAEQAEDANKSVRCALAMGRRLVQLTRVWQDEGLPPVSMRAGIYTGEVAAGSVGSEDRFEYAVIGDVVNTASRLESYDKSLCDPDLIPIRCRILVGGPTYEMLGDNYVSREIGLLEVKGKVNKVPVFQILEAKALAEQPK